MHTRCQLMDFMCVWLRVFVWTKCRAETACLLHCCSAAMTQCAHIQIHTVHRLTYISTKHRKCTATPTRHTHPSIWSKSFHTPKPNQKAFIAPSSHCTDVLSLNVFFFFNFQLFTFVLLFYWNVPIILYFHHAIKTCFLNNLVYFKCQMSVHFHWCH